MCAHKCKLRFHFYKLFRNVHRCIQFRLAKTAHISWRTWINVKQTQIQAILIQLILGNALVIISHVKIPIWITYYNIVAPGFWWVFMCVALAPARTYIQWRPFITWFILENILLGLSFISLLNMLPSEHTKDTPYLALTGELWSVFYEYLNNNWPCYKGFLLYMYQA